MDVRARNDCGQTGADGMAAAVERVGEAAAGHFVEAADYCRTIEEQGLSLFHRHPDCKILPAHCHCLEV